MSVHEYPEYPATVFNYLREGKTLRVGNPELFRDKLNLLIKKERNQYARGGELLILEANDVDIYAQSIEVSQRIELADTLVNAAFDDKGNWAWWFQGFGSQVAWWRIRLGLDVVCLPGFYEDRPIRLSYRIFTRPTYIREFSQTTT